MGIQLGRQEEVNSRETEKILQEAGALSTSECSVSGAWMLRSLHNTATQWYRVRLQGQDSPSNQRLFLSSQVFKWTGSNSFFVKGDLDLLMIGCGRCVSQFSPCLES